MQGSWSGAGGGGHREYFLATLLRNQFKKTSFLLFGTGNTPTFERLRSEGFDVIGCDITPELVCKRKEEFGEDSFCHPSELPERQFEVVIAVEVFEHLVSPLREIGELREHLATGGIVAGTTDFYQGGTIVDNNDPGYMSHELHVAYWSHRSMGFLAENFWHARN